MRTKSEPASAGAVAAVVSVLVALFVMLLVRPPWGVATALLAVAVAGYTSAYAVTTLQ